MPDLISPYDMVPVDAPPPDDTGEPDDAGVDAEAAGDLEAIRELVLRAHPDVVPELVAGETIADLIASVEPARAAYARLADALGQTPPVAAPVPAGGGAPIAIDPDRLPAAEKIRRGLASSNTRKG